MTTADADDEKKVMKRNREWIHIATREVGKRYKYDPSTKKLLEYAGVKEQIPQKLLVSPQSEVGCTGLP